MTKVIYLPPADCSRSAQRLTTVKEVSIAFARWKRSEAYKQWRRKQWAKQDARCYYCECDLHDIKVNVEHIIPRSKGGTNHRRNLVLACWRCNKNKGSTWLTGDERKRLRRRSATRGKVARKAYRHEQSYQEALAQSLSWIV